ncbi:uncharacterized protein LOC129949648 [Eupeodes corollae]|uniref:uncharacterized protein LOC129949648 n=1 Tax=Eupeodes corollae TaxID=290404 RepID=UPI0024923E8E|nr:uncharacterized protein LOC129949648 [Eupeodes corollae]
MISGNCNRSPQYNAMGPPGGGTQRYNPQAFMQHQQSHQQHPPLLFMAGGNVRAFPQMSRGFSMMPNRGGMGGSHPTVVQCNMQQGFANSFGYHANPAPMFHQPHHNLYHQQPQVINQQRQPQQHHHPQYAPQQYIAPPPAASHNEPSSGFINGIKNMVKGIINPLNCDFYSDHHKYYNPKYRNNYLLDIKSDNMSYKPPMTTTTATARQQPECHVKTVLVGLERGKPAPDQTLATTKVEVEKPTQLQSQECTKNIPEVLAIFSSEDFPELPAPRRSRSMTPAKTEPSPPKPCSAEEEQETPSRKHPPPKGTYFEIMCTTEPSGRRPTFGGRLKVVPPPFSLNTSCRRNNQEPTTSATDNNDCDIEGDSFVIFSNNDKPGNCMFTSFNNRPPPRQRQLSECSDDSFVVVFTEDADYLGGMQCVEDDDTSDEDDDDFDEDEDDSEDETSSEEEEEEDSSEDEEFEGHEGRDVVDSCFLGRQNNKTDRNKCDSGTGISLLCSQPKIPCNGVVPREHKQLDSGFDEKKVTFDPLPVVHVMHAWNFAYRAARKGHWEDVARDRTRFQKRIERTSVYLNPVLTPEHREKIYRSRFCDDAVTTNESQQQQQQQQCPSSKLDIGSLCRSSTSRNDDNNQKLPKLTKLPDCASF